jgi:DNA-binding transcriptional LysR family regulator
MADLTITGLRVLRAVAQHGSFTAASQRLGYTQSAVSRQVASLETAAGTALFERTARGVRLTDAGQLLLGHADVVLDELDAARRGLAGLRAVERGRLRLGAFPTAVASLVPRALALFRARHPGVEFGLREGTTPAQLKRVRSGSADLAVIGEPPDADAGAGVALEPLLDDPLLLAVGRSHPLARRRVVALDSLANEAWILGSKDVTDTFLAAAWADRGWEPRVAFTALEWTAKLGLVAQGLGVTLVPGLAATGVRPDVALVRVRGERLLVRPVLLATRAGAEPSPQARVFAEVLHSVATDEAAALAQRLR